MSTNEMNSKVQQLRELRRMADELAAEIETLTDSLKAEMTTRGTEEITGADWKITWKPVTSSRFDSTGFKKAMPELAARFMKTSTTRRFSLA